MTRLIDCAIKRKSFSPLALDMYARDADNIRAITTAAVLLPASRFGIPVLPQ